MPTKQESLNPKAVIQMTELHAKLSPSGAHRWMKCPGSVRLAEGCPKENTSYSLYGTAAHKLAYQLLVETPDKLAEHYLGQEIKINEQHSVKLDEAMVCGIQEYVDFVKEKAQEHTLLVEQRVDISDWVPECFGTADAILLDKKGRLQIIDLKFGRGVKVDAFENTQLLLYALGCCTQYAFSQIELTIVQPFLKHYSHWSCSVEQLMFYGERFKKASAKAARYLNSESSLRSEDLSPGAEQCHFCAAKSRCPALSRYVMEMILPDLSGNSDINLLNNQQLAYLLSCVDFIESWCKAVRTRAQSELSAGCAIPGYKLVQGRRGSRAWRDEQEVLDYLKAASLPQESFCTQTLRTPAALEKIFSKRNHELWQQLNPFITQSEGKPMVVSVDDQRAALSSKISSKDDFQFLPQL